MRSTSRRIRLPMRQYRRVSPELTATAAYLRASSIKVRISINNSRGVLCSSDPDSFESSLPFYYAHTIVVPIGQMLLLERLAGVPPATGATGCCTPLPQGVNGDFGLLPHGTARCSAWQKVCRIFCRKSGPPKFQQTKIAANLEVLRSRARGGMCERLKQAVLKTALGESPTGVRIPLPPPSKFLR